MAHFKMCSKPQTEHAINANAIKPITKHKTSTEHSLTFRVWHYVIIATKPVHQLQIRSIMHNYRAPPTIPPSYIRVRAVVRECGKGQTHTHTDARDQYTFHLGYASREM